MFVVEGATLFKETPSSLIEEVYVRDGEDALVTLAMSKCQRVYVVVEHVFDSLSDTVTPQGIIAVVRENLEISSLGNQILLLDGLKDPGNIGTLIRSAAGFNLDTVILVDCADVYSPKVVRSAMGGIFKLNILAVDRDCVLPMIEDYTLYALDMGGTNLKTLIQPRKYVLCVGNEAHGISEEIESRADYLVGIKAPGIESLNASVAGSIAMFYFSR